MHQEHQTMVKAVGRFMAVCACFSFHWSVVNSPLCVAHNFIQCLHRFLARGQLGKALIPGILHYFLFLIVIMEGDLDMETFFFFFTWFVTAHTKEFTMWIILTYTVIHQLRIHVGIPTVLMERFLTVLRVTHNELSKRRTTRVLGSSVYADNLASAFSKTG